MVPRTMSSRAFSEKPRERVHEVQTLEGMFFSVFGYIKKEKDVFCREQKVIELNSLDQTKTFVNILFYIITFSLNLHIYYFWCN